MNAETATHIIDSVIITVLFTIVVIIALEIKRKNN